MEDSKKTKILDSATKVFAEKGYQYATIADIAKDAGISTGLMYSYFKISATDPAALEKELYFYFSHVGDRDEQVFYQLATERQYIEKGELGKPKIYGAGLLSSIGESYNCLQPHVRKLPYSLDAVKYNFDITSQQPQLFVTPDFDSLTDVLEEFAAGMALKTGGVSGMIKAVDSEAVATAGYNSGLEVCGIFSQVISGDCDVEYIRTAGPTMLCYEGRMLPGHDKDYHRDGFGSPVGKLMGHAKPLEFQSDSDLANSGIVIGQSVVLEYESGVRVVGLLKSIIRKQGKLILMTFDQCMVTLRDHVLFSPAWGLYDMAVGEKIVSVFSGPSDAAAFGLSYPVPVEKTHKIRHTSKALKLHELYQEMAIVREKTFNLPEIEKLWNELINNYPDEWLLVLEIYEFLVLNNQKESAAVVKSRLYLISESTPDFLKLINDGIDLVDPDFSILLNSK